MDIKKWLPHVVTLLLAALLVITQHVWADPIAERLTSTTTGSSKTTINYQGYLTDSSGNPVGGPLDMAFRLYNVESGGEALWIETQNAVATSGGLFSVLLGSETAISTEIVANNNDLWLGIAVGGDEEMSPREKIASAPYAMLANVPNGSITTEKIADEAVTQAKLGAEVSLEPPDGSITQAKAPSLVESSAELNIHMQRGYPRVTATEQTSELRYTIDFDPDFSDKPVLVVTPHWDYTPYVIALAEGTCDDGDTCTVFLRRTDGGTWLPGQFQGFYWIAVGPH